MKGKELSELHINCYLKHLHKKEKKNLKFDADIFY